MSDGCKYKQEINPQICKRSEYPPIMNISNYCVKQLNGDEDEMKALVAERPVVVGFHVTENFMYYQSGVFSDPACTTIIDHALVR